MDSKSPEFWAVWALGLRDIKLPPNHGESNGNETGNWELRLGLRDVTRILTNQIPKVNAKWNESWDSARFHRVFPMCSKMLPKP